MKMLNRRLRNGYWSLTRSEEGPARLAAVERWEGLLLLTHKRIPPHFLRSSQFPHFPQTGLQVVDGVIGPVVHQTCQQALEGKRGELLRRCCDILLCL